MSTYALVHGAWGSGWHWDPVASRLRDLGHSVVAPDLPIESAEATFDDYADVVAGALGDADEVVVVGFSLGGLTAPLVALRRPVTQVIYVAALLPEPGAPLLERFRSGHPLHDDYLVGVESFPGGSRWTDPVLYRRLGYNDTVPEDVVRERFDRLRPQSTAPYREPAPDLPDVPSRYIRCTEDRMLDNAYWAPFIGDALELHASHSPMAECPDDLVALLTSLVPE